MKRIGLALAVMILPLAHTAEESWMAKLLRIAGFTAAPGQLRGPADEAMSGDVWTVRVDGSGELALTQDGGYRSPVFSPAGVDVFALKGSRLLRIPLEGGAPSTVHEVAGVRKLVGFDPEDPDDLLMLMDDVKAPLALFSLTTGKVRPLPHDAGSADERRILAQIHGDERVSGTTVVYVKTSTRQGASRTVAWTDVFVSRSDTQPRNVSRCEGTSCGQPGLSSDGQRIVFVRSAR